MSLMGSLYVGTSGLQTSQNALNTTAHNFSNMETAGYVRQQVQQSTRYYPTLSINSKAVSNQQVGLGVNYARVKHIRHEFLDQIYRRESGRSMFYEVSMQTMYEVESQLGEMNGEAFQTAIEDLWTAVQELDKDPANSVNQGVLVQRSEEFIQRAKAVYQGFCDYQDNLNLRIKQQVDKINAYGNQIVALNEAIQGIEAGNIESANDLRDTRDRLLDELSQLADIRYGEDINKNVWVQVEGVDFVKGSKCYEMAIDVDEDTGFYTPFWILNASYKLREDGTQEYDISNAKVFKMDRQISTELNTDIGGMKAMLLARGDHRADYTDIGNGYDQVSQSILMNMQAEFDQLVHNVAVKVNRILADAAGLQTGMTADSTQIRFCMEDVDGYMRKDDGSPIQMFSTVNSEGYRKVVLDEDITDGNGNLLAAAGTEVWVYTEEDPENAGSLYTVTNMRVDQELLQKPSMLSFRLANGKEDKATATALKAAFMEEIYTLNPNVKKTSNFVSYYTDLVSQVANTGSMFGSIYDNQVGAVDSIEAAREQVIGVSSDEELSNTIRFQNAYNASSRYINVVNEMLEQLLNALGA